jgi:tape measure domain-containing protein
MANNDAQYTISLKDAISKSIDDINKKFIGLDKIILKTGDDIDKFGSKGAKISNKTRGLGDSAGFASSKLGMLGRNLGIAFGGAAILAGVTKIGKSVFKLGTDFEQSEIAFGTFLGSADKGKKLLNELQEFANVTPFTNVQVDKAAKSLLAMGIEAGDLMSTMRTLGDIAAGVGLEKMPQLVLAYGQVKAATRLTGMELRQFTEAGVPLLDELSKVTGKTAAVIKDDLIPSGAITFNMVRKALEGATGEGGRFFNLMEKQSQSAAGLLSTFQGKMQLVGAELGKRWLPGVKKGEKQLINFADALLGVVRVPMSEKLQEQRSELRLLQIQVNDTSISEDDRKKILEKLKAINPDIVQGIDEQKVNYTKLNEQIENVNDNLLKQIQISSFNEEKQKLLNKRAKIKEKLTQEEITLGERVIKQSEKQANEFANVILETQRLNKELEIYKKKAETEPIGKKGVIGGVKSASERVVELTEKLNNLSSEFDISKKFLKEYNEIIKSTADEDMLSRAENLSRLFNKFNISEIGYVGGVNSAFLDQIQTIKNLRGELLDVDGQIKKSAIRLDDLQNLLGLGKTAKVGVTAVPGKDLEEGITEIKAAAPRTFNINITKMIGVESISTTTTIQETASDVGQAVLRAMQTALADAQAITS